MFVLNSVLVLVTITSAVFAQVELDIRIKGGDFALEGDVPYIVSVRAHNRHICGGSILNEYYVLTAAHCVHEYENQPHLFSIQYGTLTISELYPNVIQVKNITKHEDYVLNEQNPNDIAILQLKRRMILGDDIKPVNLPTPFQSVPEDRNAILAGWGLNDTAGVLSVALQKVTIKIFSEHMCNISDINYDSDLHICAGLPEGGKGQCTGDSGGPLVVDGIQYGIVSWSVKPCASKGHPGYFTKIQAYRNWIRKWAGV